MTAAPRQQNEPREIPLIFTGESVRAILADRKTQTRRVVKVPKWLEKMGPDLSRAFSDKALGVTPCLQVPCADGSVQRLRNPWHFPDVVPVHLWVRETWSVNKYCDGRPGNGCGPIPEVAVECRESPDAVTVLPSRAHRSIGNERGKWRASIFMPRWASRITLELSEVRVQRVREITDEDVRAEGCEFKRLADFPGVKAWHAPDGWNHQKASSAFAHGWDLLNGHRGFAWVHNPWVWCLTFRRIEDQ